MGLIKFVIACHASWDQLCCYFYPVLLVCNSWKRIYYAQYNQMTDFETEYVFCKDNRLVLIVGCLFAKASTANAGAWALEAPPSSPGAEARYHLKQHTQYQSVWAPTLKVAISTSYKKWSVGYFELKLHILHFTWLILHLVKRSIIGPL